MIYQYLLLERAQHEYNKSAEWYSERSLQATENFIAEIKNFINLICQNPFRYPKKHKHFREVKLKKFPFIIVYFINDATEQIIITSIFHTSRNPRIKYRF
jgi:plasmid stabilization system protein ParE